LTARLERHSDVIGLVAVGSMAEQDYPPDEWSDHDFYVIVRPGVQERYRDHYDWLPDAQAIVWAFRETAHGVKVLYRSGHLLEYAVFDTDELKLAKANRYRVLVDRGGIEARMSQIEHETASWASETSDAFHAGQFLTNLLVGVGRYRRGEVASAHLFVKAQALRHLLRLLVRHVASEQHGLADNIDPTRRFERVYPVLGQALRAAMLCEVPEAAGRMLALFETEVDAGRLGVPASAVSTIKEQLGVG
jgi:hypothetical protein